MNNTYAVIGGTSGIGLEITRRLVRNGETVHVFSRSNRNLEGMANVQHHELDVTGEVDADVFPESLDGLVYCPGSINLKPFRGLKEDDFKDDFEINLLGAVKVTKAALKSLKKGSDPSVVYFSTVAVQQGMPFHASVASAKGAIEGLTRSLAAEFAPKIRVNCIAPSLTQTPMAGRLLSSDSKIKSSAERHPLQRVGQASDIASVAVYLLGEESSWVSGQVLGIDGGLSSLRV